MRQMALEIYRNGHSLFQIVQDDVLRRLSIVGRGSCPALFHFSNDAFHPHLAAHRLLLNERSRAFPDGHSRHCRTSSSESGKFLTPCRYFFFLPIILGSRSSKAIFQLLNLARSVWNPSRVDVTIQRKSSSGRASIPNQKRGTEK